MSNDFHCYRIIAHAQTDNYLGFYNIRVLAWPYLTSNLNT